MARNRAIVFGALLGLALGGCIGVPLSRSKVEETLQTTSIEVGIADRAQVRQAVGPPILSSEYWRFDVFRIADWNRGVDFFVYVPIPTWEKNEGFVLVTYSDDGRVLEVASGHRAKGFWDVPSAKSETVVALGGLQLWTSEEQLYLAASPTLRDAYLDRPVPEGSCRLVISCKYSVRAHVDAASPVSDVEAVYGAGPSQTLTVLTLKAGSHRIDAVDAVPVAGVESIPASVQFDCSSRTTHYALLRGEGDGDSAQKSRRPRYRAIVEIMDEKPQVFEPLWLLLWANGQWLVEAEPVP